MYRPENLSIDGTRFLGRWNGIVPVYDVFTMQGLNAIVGCVKHNNAAYGTVLYRGQTELHPKLIPSILHGNPDREERKRREKEVNILSYMLRTHKESVLEVCMRERKR